MSEQQDTKAWLRSVAQYLNMSPSQLALSSGVAASTLTRYLNDTSGTVGISQRTLDAVSAFSGIAIYSMPGSRRRGQIEPDAVPFAIETGPDAQATNIAVKALIGSNNECSAWVMKSWALELSGVLPGDILVIHSTARAGAGDIVCARIRDFQTGGAEHVMRLFEPPYILSHSAKLGPSKPQQVDDDRISIVGVMRSVLRIPRH